MKRAKKWKGNVVGEQKNRSQDLRRRQEQNFSKTRRNPLTEGDKGSCTPVPSLLTCLFLLVCPFFQERWRLLYKRRLTFNKDNVNFTLLLSWNFPENHFARVERYFIAWRHILLAYIHLQTAITRNSFSREEYLEL